MARIKVAQCDLCGALVPEDEVTVKTTSYRGKTNGSYNEDLCSNCTVVPDDVELQPLRTRTPKVAESTD